MTILPYSRTGDIEKRFLAEAEKALARARTTFPTLSPAGLVNKPGDWDLEGIALSIEFLRQCTRAPAKRGISSYGLKHIVERWCGRYVANGAVLVAAAHVKLEMLIPMDGRS